MWEDIAKENFISPIQHPCNKRIEVETSECDESVFPPYVEAMEAAVLRICEYVCTRIYFTHSMGDE